MAIRIEHGKPKTIIEAARKAGEARIGAQMAQAAMERATRLEEQQMEMDYRRALKQQDMAIDLQMQERARAWEVEKMQLRSQVDFAREEQQRQRKLDSYDNALQQIDKEVLAGRMTEREAYPLRLKYELNRMGVDAPTPLLPAGEERAERVVSPTQRISAMRALREEEYREPTWLEKLLPWGKEPLTPEVEAEKEILQSIVRGEYTAPTASQVSPQVPEPASVKEFEDTVAQLKTIDIDKARIYYNRWAGKF